MAKKLTDDEKQRIVELLEQGKSRAQIAKETGRGVGSVDRVAKSIGWKADQSIAAHTRVAREARSAFSAERRALIAARLTEEAELLLDELHGKYLVHNFGGKDNTYAEHELDQPPTEAKFTMVRAAGVAMKTVLEIDKHDTKTDEAGSEFDQWLATMKGETP